MQFDNDNKNIVKKQQNKLKVRCSTSKGL